MVNPPKFDTLEQMNSSKWLENIKQKFKQNVWPIECERCAQTELENNTSIRLNSIARNQLESIENYLQVGGVLDNLCNAGCLTCSSQHSTRIGALHGKDFLLINNTSKFWDLPQERIVHLDINGGEPSYSKNYKRLLKNLPQNLKTLRLNTNGSTVLNELIDVVSHGVDVTVTVSFDGVGPVHELVRWPIPWKQFYQNLMTYKTMPVTLNLWTTVSALNVDDLPNIIAFAQEHQIDHSYAYLMQPYELSVKNKDSVSVQEYIQKQKLLRGIL